MLEAERVKRRDWDGGHWRVMIGRLIKTKGYEKPFSNLLSGIQLKKKKHKRV